MAHSELVIDPGAQIRFEYETMGRTFEVEATVTEVSNDTVWIDADTEEGPGIDQPEASWSGKLTQRDNGSWMCWGIPSWAVTKRDHVGKGTAQNLRVA